MGLYNKPTPPQLKLSGTQASDGFFFPFLFIYFFLSLTTTWDLILHLWHGVSFKGLFYVFWEEDTYLGLSLNKTTLIFYCFS